MGANNGDPKTAQTTQQNGQAAQQQGPSDEEVRQESSQAAEKSLQAQQKAHELKQAAAAARDPDHRQKLLEEAIDKEIEAESFGKGTSSMAISS